MKRALVVVLLLAGCSETGVMQVGPNRYRITEDNFWTAGAAEASVLRQANEHCAKSGMAADTNLQSRPAVLASSYAAASADFVCVRRQ